MKMVKSLLLGSAAGLFAVAGAQAADLPVKAKPVEYVKVCSLYGAGFYYIPGTDTCIKIGGFVRTEWNHNAAGSFSVYRDGAEALYTRSTNSLRNRSRFITSFDVRSQTEYGTLRAYARAGWQWTSQDPTVGGSSGTVYLDRAFIQFAGFTFGKTQSYFDFFCTGCYSLQTNFLWVDTGGSGTPVAAYTAQFGNGVSATLSIEDYTEQRLPVVNTNPAGAGALAANVAALFPMGATQAASNHGYEVPDIVGALRVDQAWGSAQISGAAHLNQATYYNGANQTAHPDEKWGWALGAGLTLKMPWDPKDTLSVMGTYCDGAARYCSNPSAATGSGSGYGLVNTSQVGVGWWSDAYYNGAVIGSQLENSKTWSVVGAFEHYWTPSLRQSVYAGYNSYEANSSAVDAICGGVAVFGGGGATLGAGCGDWSAWSAGSRLLWNPVANLDIGLDVMYTKVDTALAGASYVQGTQGLPPVLLVGDTHTWAGIFRVQRNFWP
jgi:hypothetical protein